MHCTGLSKDENWLVLSDLGTDRLVSYRYDKSTGEVGQNPVSFLPLPGRKRAASLCLSSDPTCVVCGL